MIEIKHKQDCCGCSACVQKCPKQCILMIEDEEGFLYPKVDLSNCIDCHLCEKVCPIIYKDVPGDVVACYAAINPDKEVRKVSSSGGVFTMLAEQTIKESGVVVGASFDEQWRVCHSSAETLEGRAAFRGSKYVQSNIGNTYKETLHFLNSGRKVLFSGAPCQIAGLKHYLGKEYENLLTVDFICHGVPSPGVFRSYLEEELNNYAAPRSRKKKIISSSSNHHVPEGDILIPQGITITDIRFRDKKEGWKKYSFTLHLVEEGSGDGKKNTVILSTIASNNIFMKGFFSDLYLRPSCYNCPSKSLSSGSDITIADYWRIERIHPELDDDMGVSAVIVKTEKGVNMSSSFSKEMILSDFSFIRKYNCPLDKSATIPNCRIDFFDRWKVDRFDVLIQDLCKKTYFQMILTKLRSLYLLVKR